MTQSAVDSRHTVDNLINRAERGGLTGDEAAKLRDGVAKLHDELDRLTAMAARLDAVRALAGRARNAHAGGISDYDTGKYNLATRILGALDAHTNPKDQPGA